MNLAMPVLLFALHSLVAGGAQRHWLQACLPDGHQPQCLSLSRARISPSSPKQLGMVSPELSCRVTRQPRLEDSQSPAVVRG